MTRNGPLANEKDTSLLSTSSTTAWTHTFAAVQNYPNIARNPFPPAGPPSASGTEPDIRKRPSDDENYIQGPKKKRGEREGRQDSRKRRRHVRHFASFFFLLANKHQEKENVAFVCFPLGVFSFSLLEGPGDDDEIEDKKKSRAKEGGERSGRIKIDKVSPFFFLFPCKDCCDGPLSRWAGSSIVQKPKTDDAMNDTR